MQNSPLSLKMHISRSEWTLQFFLSWVNLPARARFIVNMWKLKTQYQYSVSHTTSTTADDYGRTLCADKGQCLYYLGSALKLTANKRHWIVEDSTTLLRMPTNLEVKAPRIQDVLHPANVLFWNEHLWHSRNQVVWTALSGPHRHRMTPVWRSIGDYRQPARWPACRLLNWRTRRSK